MIRLSRLAAGLRIRRGRAGHLGAAAVVLVIAAACQPSAPPGFTGSVPPGSGGSAAPGASAAAPVGSGLVAGKSIVTTDGGTVKAVGLSSGRTADFTLPAGSAQMTVSVCPSNQVIPFVTLYDSQGNKLSIVVEPDYTLTKLAGGSYYLDVVANPDCAWQILIKPQ